MCGQLNTWPRTNAAASWPRHNFILFTQNSAPTHLSPSPPHCQCTRTELRTKPSLVVHPSPFLVYCSMILASTQSHNQDAFVGNHSSLLRASTSPFANQATLSPTSSLLNAVDNPMERSVPEYSQSGLPSPYPSTYGDTQSEASSADHASAAQYPTPQEARSSNYSASATPTSEYGTYAQSARSSSSFPEHSLRQYHPAASNPSGSSGGMAQTPTSPSMPLQDGRNHQSQQVKSDSDMPIDPSIAAPSPSYGHSQYSAYPAPPPQDMSHSYPQSAGSLYAQPRPDWANYGHPGQQMPPHHVFPHTPTSAPPARGQVGSLSLSPPEHGALGWIDSPAPDQDGQCYFLRISVN